MATNLKEVGERLERLLEELRTMVTPPAWERANDLVRLVVDLYGQGLGRIIEVASENHQTVDDLRHALVGDHLIASLLVLHGLHPVEPEERIRRALAKVNEELGVHAPNAELVSLDEAGVVRLRVDPNHNGHAHPSAAATARVAIEHALAEAVPEVTSIEIDGLGEPPPKAAALYKIGLHRPASSESEGSG